MSEETHTYDKPNEEHYLDSLIRSLGHKQEYDLVRLLDGSTCSIRTTTSFSDRKLNAYLFRDIELNITLHAPVLRQL
jgi:hypothetical protein